MITLAGIERILARHRPEILPASGLTHAAVALVLREEPAGPLVLFIERAAHEGDPWSGDLGFPGGKVEGSDADPRSAAERETREEIGLDLADARYLGQLSDIAGAHMPVRVSCFVYSTGHAGSLILSDEVRDAFWVPLDELLDLARHETATVHFNGSPFERPAIRLARADKPVLWGITYRLVMQFLGLLNERSL